MNRDSAVPVAGTVVVAALLGALMVRAAEEPIQPCPPGTLLTVAGNGKDSFSGDGGPAIRAALSAPQDQAVDATGNLYIADGDNLRVRKVSPDGTITTVAGTGQGGLSGDGGPAVKAKLTFPTAVAVDLAGDLFISDGNRVRKVDLSGIITTVAGGGMPADGVGDDGPATAARLQRPYQLAVDVLGNLFIAEYGGRRIRKVNPVGTITTVAGDGKPADGRGDGGLATAAAFRGPDGVAVDPVGNLYICDFADGRIRKVGLDKIITTVAGGGQPADGVGDGGPATDARLDFPNFITVDAGGNLFIAEIRGERVRKVSPAGIITTVAGNGQVGHTGDGGMATAAPLNSPESVAVDRAGNLYFTEGPRYKLTGGREKMGNNLVRKVIGVAVPG
jgi:sugar lactone lactonase YvrE